MSVAHQIRSFSPNARRILVSTFFAGLGSSGFALLYNLYLLSLGYHADFIGLVASVTTLSTASAGPAAFMLSRRIPLGRILTFGFLLQVIGCTGLALSGATAGILAFSVVFGLSQGFYWAPLPPFLAENSSSEERNHLFSINIAVQLLAGILGYLAAGQAPSLLAGALALEPTGSLRTTLLIATAAAGLALLPILTVRRAIPAPGQPQTIAAVSGGEESGQRHVVALGASALAMGVATGLSFPFFNVYFVTQQGASAEAVGRIFALSSVLSTVAALTAPALAARVGYVRAIALSRLAAGAAMAAMAFSSSLGVAIATFWLRNFALQIMAPLIDAFGMAAVPANRRAVQASVTSTLWHAGYGLTSLFSGLIIVGFGFAPPFIGAAVVILGNAIVFWLYYR
ncbi:MAG: MFS transporter, partial [Chloroflexota bacterium]|nr:MFS transporter [Chloroflexota bacterium]